MDLINRTIKNVTLMAISSIEIDKTIDALLKSSNQLNFESIRLLTHKRPYNLPDKIEYHYCPKINNIMDFNKFVFFDLADYVETSHCLMIQYHGYVVAPQLWQDEWLKWDYIGAGWPLRENSYIANNGDIVRVGNGGVSLRSKKLMSLPKKNNWELREQRGFYNEDGGYCVYWRKEALAEGIKYAPLDVAVKFSYETPIEENSWGTEPHFCFHRHKSRWMTHNGL